MPRPPTPPSRRSRSRRVASPAGSGRSILADTLGDPTEAARRLVIDGPQVALRQTPLASIGDLVTADRQEIEAFRAIGNLLSEYLATTQTKPISIGVFGPPGAGKSFGVEQVAAQVARQAAAGRRLEKLEFNLSQFTDLADLNAAFHLVRDKGLAGSIPLVFFDEFDSRLETDLGWLRSPDTMRVRRKRPCRFFFFPAALRSPSTYCWGGRRRVAETGS